MNVVLTRPEEGSYFLMAADWHGSIALVRQALVHARSAQERIIIITSVLAAIVLADYVINYVTIQLTSDKTLADGRMLIMIAVLVQSFQQTTCRNLFVKCVLANFVRALFWGGVTKIGMFFYKVVLEKAHYK
ncbi:MAG: hypothetical protein FJZ58_05095 [Chlamydiae bacterium]|nr:hypothetical protein [Chlamydiota bacterium]